MRDREYEQQESFCCSFDGEIRGLFQKKIDEKLLRKRRNSKNLQFWLKTFLRFSKNSTRKSIQTSSDFTNSLNPLSLSPSHSATKKISKYPLSLPLEVENYSLKIILAVSWDK
jgi:hypothetical protein